jgi:hypothetical protein
MASTATDPSVARHCDWVAGHGGQVDDNGKSLAGNFEAQ